MPDFQPRPAYVREMKRYGILPKDIVVDAAIDVYATDRAYWRSLWYKRPLKRQSLIDNVFDMDVTALDDSRVKW